MVYSSTLESNEISQRIKLESPNNNKNKSDQEPQEKCFQLEILFLPQNKDIKKKIKAGYQTVVEGESGRVRTEQQLPFLWLDLT